MAIEEKKYLGSAGVGALVTWVAGQDDEHLQAAKDYADSLAENYDAAGTAATKVQELANGQVKTNTEHIGTMDNLETTAKGDLVSALNEVRNAVSAGGTAAAITMEEKTTELGDGVAKAYVLKQGENTVGTINIPKDMVVQSGEVVVDPAGQPAGTYIKLTLANASNDVIYVNVGTLVDIYKAKASATQIQIAIDSATREISASIVAGSVTATELADNAVTTVKIADGNVTKAKLATDVQASLDKADAAATDATTKANAAQAAAEATAKAYTDTELGDLANELIGRIELVEGPVTETRIEDGAVSYDKLSDALQTNYLDKIADLEAKKHEHSNKTQLDTYDKTQTELLASAQTAAETYVNEAMSSHDEEYGILSNNVGDIKGRVEALEEANVQSDWNQSDPAAADYVKNRTHYEDVVLDEVLSEMTITSSSAESNTGYSPLHQALIPYTELEYGVEYVLVWDGEEYTFISDGGNSGSNLFDKWYAVDMSYFDTMPAYITTSGPQGNSSVYIPNGDETHTISIYKKNSTVVQLDEKFIPDSIARSSAVEGVAGRMTTAEGKIEALESVTYVEMTAEEVNALIAANTAN